MAESRASLELLRNEAIKNDRCFSKGRLKSEFRMKPGPDATPVRYYKNGFGGEFGVYRISDCVPLRPSSASPASPNQIRGRKISGLKSKLRSAMGKASREAGDWLTPAAVFLDTETTGLANHAQIVEIAVVDVEGRELLNSRVKASVPIEEDAFHVHGITEDALQDAAEWPEIEGDLRQLLKDRTLIIFNSDFDTRLMKQSSEAFGLSTDWIDALNTKCAMSLAADAYGPTNRYGSISLASAVEEAGILWEGDAHSALGDAKTTCALVKEIARYALDLDREIQKTSLS